MVNRQNYVKSDGWKKTNKGKQEEISTIAGFSRGVSDDGGNGSLNVESSLGATCQ